MDRPAFIGYFSLSVTKYVFGLLSYTLPLWSGFTLVDVSVSGYQGLWTRCFFEGSFTCCGSDKSAYLNQKYLYSKWIYGLQILLGIHQFTGLIPILMTMRSGIPSFVAAIFNFVNAALALISSIIFVIGIEKETWMKDNMYHVCFYLAVISSAISLGLGIVNLYNYFRVVDEKNVPNIKKFCRCPPDCFHQWDVKKSAFTTVVCCYILQCVATYLPFWSHTHGSDGSPTGFEGLLARCVFSGEFTCCGVISIGASDGTLTAQAGLGAVWFAQLMASCTGILTIAIMRKTMFTDVTRKGTFAIVISSSITMMSLVVSMAGYATVVRETLSFCFYCTLLSTLAFFGVTIIAFLTNRKKASLKCTYD